MAGLCHVTCFQLSASLACRAGVRPVMTVAGPAPGVVLVHDGVRPLVPPGLVTALVTAAAADGAAGLTRPLVSTVLETPPGQGGRLGRSLDRSRHCASETPQAFSYPVIRRAYQQVQRSTVAIVHTMVWAS